MSIHIYKCTILIYKPNFTSPQFNSLTLFEVLHISKTKLKNWRVTVLQTPSLAGYCSNFIHFYFCVSIVKAFFFITLSSVSLLSFSVGI